MQFAGSSLSIKALEESGHIAGLLAGFDNVDRYGDRLVKGCFTKTLEARNTPLPMLLFHDTQRPIGAWTKWKEQSEGLYVEGAFVLETKDAQEAYALTKAGALTGLSIGFLPKRQSTDQHTGVNTITEVDLVEGSLVAVPANPKAEVSAVKQIAGPRDIAELLRGSGFSRDRAQRAAGAAWKAISQQNDEETADAELADLIRKSAARLRSGGMGR